MYGREDERMTYQYFLGNAKINNLHLPIKNKNPLDFNCLRVKGKIYQQAKLVLLLLGSFLVSLLCEIVHDWSCNED